LYVEEGDDPRAGQPRSWTRFEHPEPNDLWQMDFKGHFPLGEGRCHPLTVLDDHSRFALAIGACADERTKTVARWLERLFEQHGLPERILTDNGPPWGTGGPERHTLLTVWLLIGAPADPLGEYPAQLYFMNQGPWMSGFSYAVQGGALLALASLFHAAGLFAARTKPAENW